MVRHPRTALCGIVLCTLLGPGCSEEPDVERQDQKGSAVTVLDVPGATPDLPTWKLSEAPTLVLGDGSDGDPTFHRLGHLRRLEDGSLMVADRGDARILLYGPSGRFIRALGGMGFGPGEFRTISGMVPVEDGAVVVFDGGARRLTTMTLDGEVVATHSVATDGDFSHPLAGYGLEGRLHGGDLVLIPDAIPVEPDGGTGSFRVEAPALLLDRQGRSLDSLGDIWGMEAFADERATSLVPMGWRRLATLHPEGLLSADASAGRIELIGQRGRVERLILLARDPVPIPSGVRNAWLEQRTSRASDPSMAQELRRWLEQIPFPEHLPHFEALKVAPDGHIWLQDVSLPGHEEPRRWMVLSMEGEVVAQVMVPANLRVEQITSDEILGVWTDSLGVQTVRGYRITRQDG